MTDRETITVADVSAGPGGDGTDPGTTVSLPAVEILTGRGFITGKSGSGKSNTASVVVEKLLSANFPVLVVDTDGEYYGLKEEFEILHVGADEECDIQVSPEHAEKIASLALEGNVPIILDVSGYLDESEAKSLLLQTTRHLFAKEKKVKQPFLMLVEEVHEYIPEGGGMDECGRMLVKVGKRGRKHGLGIIGISQRPADVKKDFITQCDWLVWHRLTWRNDTKVVKRILGKEYSDAIEDMGDGEGFLVTDWSESIRRVQFRRKQTFDAGATPGLDDFERPDLKSVSSDLVDELRDISDEKERRESELADLRQELDRKEQRIAELEAELEEARDLRRFADQMAQAMFRKAEAPYRGGEGRNLSRPDEYQRALREYEDGDVPAGDPEAVEAAAEHGVDATELSVEDAVGEAAAAADEEEAVNAAASADPDVDVPFPLATDPEMTAATEAGDTTTGTDDATNGETDSVTLAAAFGESNGGDGTAGVPDSSAKPPLPDGAVGDVAGDLRTTLDEFDAVTRRMLAHYRSQGIADPVTAQVAAGGPGDHKVAYARNRTLRKAGFVRHAGRGKYAYALPDHVRTEYAHRLHPDAFDEAVAAVERVFVDEEPESDANAIEADASAVSAGEATD
ncbi:ATP-binding protein [Salinigranum sp. GCM10025319]|uniref:ATP-binding protein n=1 Tax=Salinigranum sp. GCM10025319 TaxID=3252687 RepID=UPI00361D52FF